MASRLWLAACGLALAQCAPFAPSPEAFTFAVMGDTPYNAREEAAFLRMIERVNGEPLAFVVHVGDLNGERCTDALFERRKRQLDASTHPLVYTPGDNEWADCRSPAMGGWDPLERLQRLREIFFNDDASLGRRRLALDVQRECVAPAGGGCACPIYRENRQWAFARIRFVTLNYAGQDNNTGHDAAGDAEAACRNEANRRWLEDALDRSRPNEVAALVIVTQANPWFTPNDAFRGFVDQLRRVAAELRKPVLLVHGDTHLYRVDQPLRDSMGIPVANFTRLETYGSPFVGWVKVTVDPARGDPFSFDPRLEAAILQQ